MNIWMIGVWQGLNLPPLSLKLAWILFTRGVAESEHSHSGTEILL